MSNRMLCTGLALALSAGAASAQGAAEATVSAGPEGFALVSSNGDFRIKLRGYLQLDGRYFVDDDERPANDTFVLRRARPILEGTVFEIFDFRIMPDFGGGSSTIQDAYLEARLSQAVRVRAGKFKPPIGLERLQSAADLVFVERALPTALVPNRDLGVQVGGELAAGRLEYAAGLFNGVVDGSSGDSDGSDDKELAARLLWKPLARTNGAPPRVDLALGLAASSGDENGTLSATGLPSIRTPGQQTFFVYLSDATVAGTSVADGARARLAPQGWLYAGPFGLLAEWVENEQRVRRDTIAADLVSEAWQVQLSWVLSGERNSYRGVAPRQPFDPEGDGRGAWIVAARASGFAADDAAFPLFADPARSAREATSLGIGVSWNLTRGVRWMLDYDVTSFDGGAADGADRPDEKALFTRFQIAF